MQHTPWQICPRAQSEPSAPLSSPRSAMTQRTQRQMLRMILGVKRRRQRSPDNHDRNQADDADVSNSDAGHDSSEHDTDTICDNDQIIEEVDHVLEPWVDGIKRATAEARRRMQQLSIEDWTVLHRKRKFQWARKVVGGPIGHWQMKVLFWRPNNEPEGSPHRRPGRQKTRSTDDLRKLVLDYYGHSDWHCIATMPAWDDLQGAYVEQ